MRHANRRTAPILIGRIGAAGSRIALRLVGALVALAGIVADQRYLGVRRIKHPVAPKSGSALRSCSAPLFPKFVACNDASGASDDDTRWTVRWGCAWVSRNIQPPDMLIEEIGAFQTARFNMEGWREQRYSVHNR